MRLHRPALAVPAMSPAARRLDKLGQVARADRMLIVETGQALGDGVAQPLAVGHAVQQVAPPLWVVDAQRQAREVVDAHLAQSAQVAIPAIIEPGGQAQIVDHVAQVHAHLAQAGRAWDGESLAPCRDALVRGV